ncbi:hypothetical protein ACIP5N_27665 [Streptomyces sp. NPDC088768]|uniref:recombination directionality factor n=1 Tax=Streptomyces sp. NPDC088768 TaxID=3365894 RepID=UPI0038032850
MPKLRIYDTDPDAKPVVRDRDQYAGRFRSGRLVGTRPEALGTWRVTTASADDAAAIAELYGGTPGTWETTGEDFHEVLTERESVNIVIPGPGSLRADMRLYGRQGMIHHCDGVTFLSPDAEAGNKCGCPEKMEDRKAFAKSGRGPAPHVALAFRLADAYHLGTFNFQSSSWKLAEILDHVDGALSDVEGEALAELRLELVEYTTNTGREVSYRKPVIRVLGPYITTN